MRAIGIVRRLCKPCLEQVHAARFRAVLRAVEALIAARFVSLTAVGRAVRGKLQPRHGIKMMDRLLGNPKWHTERRHWVAALVRRIVGTERRFVVLLDWTQLHGEFWALVAAVPFMGRSLPIYAEAHHESKLGSRQIQTEFIRELRRLFPDRCRLVVVADGGFRSPFFVACRDAGVDYVIRLRNERAMARLYRPRDPSAWRDGVAFGEIFNWARRSAQCLGLGVPFLTSQVCDLCRLILAPAPKKARRRARYADDYERKRACEPWLLATSLDNEAAQNIVTIYGMRMQVEECFRDAKNARFGWGLEFCQTRSTKRLNVLLLLVSLAFAAIVLVGAVASDEGLERRFRASSRRERVLSVFSLGNLVARSVDVVKLRFSAVWKFTERIRLVSRSLFPPIQLLVQDDGTQRRYHHDFFCADCGWRSTQQ